MKEGFLYEDSGTLWFVDKEELFFPTTDDILADDWEIVPEPPKMMTFQEAVKAMKEGKEVRRQSWKNPAAKINLDTEGEFRYCHIPGSLGSRFRFEVPDFETSDWIVAEEEQ
jgi:hypothetical protein